MTLRTHLDRYCMSRAMANDPISSTHGPRSRSQPARSNIAVLDRPSPFFRPPGWLPPQPRPDRPIIIQIDLKPMQQLAACDPYYILAPKVASNLSTSEYDGLFHIYKVIYPDYASRHYAEELQNLVVSTFAQRWAIFLDSTVFFLSMDTAIGPQSLEQPSQSILDILQSFFPRWRSHQHRYPDPQQGLYDPHPDASDTGLVLQIKRYPCKSPVCTSQSCDAYTSQLGFSKSSSTRQKKKGTDLFLDDFLNNLFPALPSILELPESILLYFSRPLPTSCIIRYFLALSQNLLLLCSSFFIMAFRWRPMNRYALPPQDLGHDPPYRTTDPTTEDSTAIPRATRDVPQAHTLHTIQVKRIHYPSSTRPDELWVLEVNRDGHETWRTVESFLGTLHLTTNPNLIRQVANQWRRHFTTSTPSLRWIPHPRFILFYLIRNTPMSPLANQSLSSRTTHPYFSQACWGRSAHRHSQGEPVSLFWPQSRTRPPTSPTRPTTTPSQSSTPLPTPTLQMPVEQPISHVSSNANMSDSSV